MSLGAVMVVLLGPEDQAVGLLLQTAAVWWCVSSCSVPFEFFDVLTIAAISLMNTLI